MCYTIVTVKKGDIKMKTTEIRKKLGMNQKELAEAYDIPVKTVRNWDSGDCCPEYVINMLKERLVIKEAYDKLNILENKIDDLLLNLD